MKTAEEMYKDGIRQGTIISTDKETAIINLNIIRDSLFENEEIFMLFSGSFDDGDNNSFFFALTNCRVISSRKTERVIDSRSIALENIKDVNLENNILNINLIGEKWIIFNILSGNRIVEAINKQVYKINKNLDINNELHENSKIVIKSNILTHINMDDELKELEMLLAQELITEDEFIEFKKQIVNKYK